MSEAEFRVIEASRGKQWLFEAWEFMGNSGKPLLRAILLLVLLWSLIRIPIAGMVIAIFDPLLRGGVLLGIAATMMKQNNQPGGRVNLLDAWQKPQLRQPLILLGLALIAVSFLFGAWVAADLQLIQEGIAAGTIPTDALQRLVFAIAINMAVVGFAVWLGLPELVFRGGSPLPAIVRGIRATLANWKALGMLGLWLGLGLFAVFLLLIVVTMLLTSILPAYPLLGFIVLLPGIFVMVYLVAFMFVLQFICWRDILAPPNYAEFASRPEKDSADEGETRVIV